MKLIHLLILLISLSCSNIISGQEIKKNVKAGFKAGLNIANIAGTQSKPHINFRVGFLTQIDVSEKFSIQPELLYSRQGYIANFNDLKVKSSYINLPIMGQIELNNVVKLHIGPQLGYNINTTFELNDSEIRREPFKKFDFGMGTGFQLSLSETLFFQSRYVIGLNKLRNEGNIRNSVISASLGVYL